MEVVVGGSRRQGRRGSRDQANRDSLLSVRSDTDDLIHGWKDHSGCCGRTD